MLTLSAWRIGRVAVIHCAGRIVRSDAAFRLRDAVARQREALVVLLDLSGVQALDGGGLGMLIFLQMWTHDRGIQLKVFDPVARVRRSLERTRSAAAAVEIAATDEVLSLLGWGLEELQARAQSSA
jgi:anti-anti-sigma regulatory factor